MTHSRRAAQVGHDPRDTPGGISEVVRIGLLGDFRVSVGARTIGERGWRLKKAKSLIKLLALAPGHRLHREQAMEWLWPDLDPKAAANNLRYALHVARRTLEPTSSAASRYLRLLGDHLALCPDGPLWVDVEAFEDAAVAARRARDPAAYRGAVDLYAGDLLPQDRYEAWAEDRREELRRLYLVLLIEMTGLYEEREEYGPAIEALSRVVASEPTREEAHAGLMRLYALSRRPQRALGQYEQLRQALREKLGTEPAATSRHLYEQIAVGRLPISPSLPSNPSLEESPRDRRHNLPALRTSFVGRERELVELKRALVMTRLLTLTGTGGCGKTRLALEVAKDLVGAYAEGVWLVELAGLSEPTLVPQALAAALTVRERPNLPLIDALVDALRTKNMLLVLDNCEHLIGAAARSVDILLSGCPRLRILATSREPLAIAGETNWQVPTLALPAPRRPLTVEELERYESARLFLERVRHRNPAFVPTPRNAPAVAEICRRLEGIPLAIELAAARVGLSVEQIAERLDDSLRVLTTGGRTTSPRQQTFRGALDWSYELLSEPEQRLFGRLSVFAGGWSLEAVEAVGAGGDIEAENVLDLLLKLADKSLVVAEATMEGRAHYRMLEPIRQYGREKLEESGKLDDVRRRHAAWFLSLAEQAEPELKRARQQAWLERLESEHDNLRAALSWALESEDAELGLRLAGALGEFWHMRGHLSEGRRWLEATLAKGDAPSASGRAKALARAGYIAWEQGDYERSVALSEESLALSRKLGDEAGVAAVLYTLGWAALFRNELEQASSLTEEAITLQREMNDTVGVARSLSILGLAVNAQHDHERAIALHEEGLALARDTEDSFAIVLSLMLGAIASLNRGDHQRTKVLLKEGLELSQRLKTMHVTAGHLHLSAALAGSQEQPVRSARLWGAGESLREAIGTILSPVEHHFYDPYLAAARAQLDEATWEAAWAEGKAMMLEEACEYALSEEKLASSTISVPKQAPADKPARGLTRREEEVAGLVAQGLTNRRVAAELSISEHTVATHVREILKKLGLRSRTQIAAWVSERRTLPKRG